MPQSTWYPVLRLFSREAERFLADPFATSTHDKLKTLQVAASLSLILNVIPVRSLTILGAVVPTGNGVVLSLASIFVTVYVTLDYYMVARRDLLRLGYRMDPFLVEFRETSVKERHEVEQLLEQINTALRAGTIDQMNDALEKLDPRKDTAMAIRLARLDFGRRAIRALRVHRWFGLITPVAYGAIVVLLAVGRLARYYLGL